jgi:hypothetical protein
MLLKSVLALAEAQAAALLDFAWHTLPADAPLQNVPSFEASALKKFNVDLVQVPTRYRSTYFTHIWSNRYSARYYSYLWTKVRYRRLRLVPRARRPDATEWRPLPQARTVTGRTGGLRADLSRLPRLRPGAGTAAEGTRAGAALERDVEG